MTNQPKPASESVKERIRRASQSVAHLWASRQFHVLILSVTLIISLTGAFGTGLLLSPVMLGLYWLFISTGTATIGVFVSSFVAGDFTQLHLWSRLSLFVHLSVTAAVSAYVFVVNAFVFGASSFSLTEILSIVLTAFVITMLAINLTSYKTSPNAGEDIRLMRRMDPSTHGDLVSISVSDHHVIVTTSKGQQKLLMRLSDAIAETEGVDGVQIHRSHWVATDQIQRLERDKERTLITLSDGQKLPVSRARLPELDEQGLTLH